MSFAASYNRFANYDVFHQVMNVATTSYGQHCLANLFNMFTDMRHSFKRWNTGFLFVARIVIVSSDFHLVDV